MNSNSDPIDPYSNLPKGLNDENLWKAMIQRIDEIDTIRRSIRDQIKLSRVNEQTQNIPIDPQWLCQTQQKSATLARERIALHEEMKTIRTRIKRARRERNGRPVESLAIEFMLIAQQKLPINIFNDIRNEAAVNIACFKQ
ncbi:MAG: hypothetical protein HQK75_11850 [Candidatus Magnetomorum sp.]|nr:hypothetical protein [Candidatus Magnetomorum sp.]